jgi:hypothetical protein
MRCVRISWDVFVAKKEDISFFMKPLGERVGSVGSEEIVGKPAKELQKILGG